MRIHSAFRTVLLCSLPCLAAFALPSGPLQAAPSKGNPAQFTNGQNGTPNLPIAPMMVVDKNNMRGRYASGVRAYSSESASQSTFLQNLDSETQKAIHDLAQQPVPEKTVRDDYGALATLIEAEYKRLSDDAAMVPLNHSFYLGAEVRAGQDKPVYSPELTYGDTRSGLELGVAGYSQGAFSEGASRRDGLGVSLKYIPGRFAAHSLESFGEVQKTQAHALVGIEALTPDIKKLHGIVNPATERIEEIETRIKRINDALHAKGVDIKSAINKLGENSIRSVDEYTPVLKDFVAGTRRPALAFVVGDQSYRGGDIANAGAIASRLYRFGEGAPGVTAVAVAQYFHDSFRERGDRNAGQLGLAAIYQDTTLKLTDAPEKLGPPWHYKLGLEYTTPLLGLHETGAVFARYRWTPSYVEVTTTYGKDGLRKDYLDISVGKSFTF